MNSRRNIVVLLALTWSVFGAVSAEESYGVCQTPNDAPGECMLIQKCTELYNTAVNPNLEKEELLFLRRSKCGELGKSILVCCPKPQQPDINILERKPEYDCETPNGKKGRCIYILECGSLLPLVKENVTPNEIDFLTKSVCRQGTRQVCCPDPPKIDREELLLPPNCGKTSLAGRIYGGTAADIDEFPWTALLIYTRANGDTTFLCGASLINDRYVVTAAHCVSKEVIPPNWRLTGVRLGEWDLETPQDCQFDKKGNQLCSDPPIDLSIEEEICHPLYNETTKKYDIALLRLQEKVNFNNFTTPICLPGSASSSASNYEGVAMGIAGWGITEQFNKSLKKLKALIQGENLERCKAKYRMDIDNTQICAGGEKGVDSCNGDSGGPLMFVQSFHGRESFFLIGVISFGPTPCGQKGFPGVYTRVDTFISWIQNTIRK
ncbi:serine protease easter-like [Zeugodacus cucurbitae]|uniref:serine protease easter-like n=1 Tax=Zeugodacus cucurbitae TaxID=28588 RepID=UPI0005968936|nr:serine protease easter-like [Zeugodacus cucurbitae]